MGSILEARGSAPLMNSCSFCLSIVLLAAPSVRMKKMKRKKPHTVTVREALCGQSITNQSLKVLVLPLEDVLHYLQIFNGETDVRARVCVCVRLCAKGGVFISLRRFPPSFQSLKTSYLPVNVCRWSRYYQSPISTIFKHETHAQVHSAAHTDAHASTCTLMN